MKSYDETMAGLGEEYEKQHTEFQQEKKQLAEQFFQRVMDILSKENIKYEPKAVAEVINKFFPDWRKVLNELQRYSASGKIDAGILLDISEVNIKLPANNSPKALPLLGGPA